MVARKPSKLSAFAKFLDITGPTAFGGKTPDQVMAEVAEKNKALAKYLKGKPLADILKGGASIKSEIMLDPFGNPWPMPPSSN